MKKTIFIIFYFICILSLTKAQTFTGYTSSNSGILNNKIFGVTIDKLGNKWMACDSGISKYDGINWTTYFLYNPTIVTFTCGIAIDKYNNKWVATYNGVYKYNDTTWTHYTSANSGLSHTRVLSIAVDSNNNIFAGTLHGLSKFNGVNWTTVDTCNTKVLSIAVEPKGNHAVWAVLEGGIGVSSLIKYENNSVTYYDTQNTVFLGGGANNSIAIDNNNNIWIDSHNHGLYKYDREHWTNYYDSLNYLTFYNFIEYIAFDEFGNKWCSSAGNPNSIPIIMKFNDTTWTYYTSFCPYGIIRSMAFDSIGNLWMGVYPQGLWKMDCMVPTSPTAMAGPTTVAKGQTNVKYKLAHQNDALYYTWLLPNGFTGSSNADTIVLDIGTNAASGIISAYGHNSCGDGFAFNLNVTVTLAGIDEETLSNKLTVFPNPSTNQTTISYPQLTNEGELQIYNTLGQLVYQEKLTKASSQKEINTQNFKAGLYKIIVKEKGIIIGQVSLVKE